MEEADAEEEPKQEPEAETGFLLLCALEKEERERGFSSKGSGRKGSERVGGKGGQHPQPVRAAEGSVGSSPLARGALRSEAAMAPTSIWHEENEERKGRDVRMEGKGKKGKEKEGKGVGKEKEKEKRREKGKGTGGEPQAASAVAAVVAPVLPGVPDKIRELAEKRANRLAQEGAEEDWRERPDTPYRQRLMAAREASRGMKGSVAQAVYHRMLRENTGLDEACSSCDDRAKKMKNVVRSFAQSFMRKVRARKVAAGKKEERKKLKKKKEKESDSESLYEGEADLKEVEEGAEADNEGASDEEAEEVATTLAKELSPHEDPGEPDKAPGQRSVGSSSSVLMHRVVESLELGRLCAKRDELQKKAEEAEDAETHDQAEEALKGILERIRSLKDYVKSSDKTKPTRLTEENRNDKSFHDIRYYKAIEAGENKGDAWRAEKKRRRATLFRMKTAAERAQKRRELEDRWMAEFQSGEAKEEDYEDADNEKLDAEGIETEVLLPGEGAIKVARGAKAAAKKRVRRALTKEELSKFREELKEDELALLTRPRGGSGRKSGIRRSSDAVVRRKENRRKKQREKRKQKRARDSEEPQAVSAEAASKERVEPKEEKKEEKKEERKEEKKEEKKPRAKTVQDAAAAAAKSAAKAFAAKAKGLAIARAPPLAKAKASSLTPEELEKEREENRKRKEAAHSEKTKASQEKLKKQLARRDAGSSTAAASSVPAPKTPPKAKAAVEATRPKLWGDAARRVEEAIASAPWREGRSRSPAPKSKGKEKGESKGKEKGKSKGKEKGTRKGKHKGTDDGEEGLDLNSLGALHNDATGQKITWNLDTGATASVMPTTLSVLGEQVKGEEVRFKTASGELLNSQGKVQVKGLNEEYRKVAVTAHVADVHRPRAAGSSVSKRSLIMLDEKGGVLVHKDTPAYNRILKVLEEEKEKEEKKGKKGEYFTPVHQERGVYVFHQWAEAPKTPFKGQGENL